MRLLNALPSIHSTAFPWLIMILTPLLIQSQWTQLGMDIDGEAMSDLSGASVSISRDGSRVAIGATGNDDNGNFSGHTRVYEWNGSAWIQLGNDIDGEAALDFSGFSVSLSQDGSRIAIGATGNDDGAGEAGHVRVYQWNGSAWLQLGADINGKAMDEATGFSVSLSWDGSRVAIGATGIGSPSGHTRVYQWNGIAWVQLGSDINGEAIGDQSGWSASLSEDGSRLAIGAIQGGLFTPGYTRIYELVGIAWIQLGGDIIGEELDNQSGYSVSLSADGNRVAIGAPGNDASPPNDNIEDIGHVRVFEWNGSAWVQLGSDINGEAIGDNSGTSVSLSADGNRVAIGAPYNNGGNGHVRVYEWLVASWVQLDSDIDDEEAFGNSGYSVSISADGTRIAIGANTNNNSNGSEAGRARVYEGFIPVTIPTLSQWGLIMLGICLAILGLVVLRTKVLAL